MPSNYPMGADNSSAPWNSDDFKLDYEATISQTLHRTVELSTTNIECTYFNEYEDEGTRVVDTDAKPVNIEADYKDTYFRIEDILKGVQDLYEKVKEKGFDSRDLIKLEILSLEAKDWISDEQEFIQD